MTISESLTWATEYLKNHQIEDPRLEAEILLSHALAITRTELITQGNRIIGAKGHRNIEAHIKRRALHEPTAYITGFQPFLSQDFYVNRSVLIPRPETELLVETTLSRVASHESRIIIADIGTGSGVIAISLAKKLPKASVIGIDLSPEALKVAKRNAEDHEVSDRCQFMIGYLFDPLKEKVDIIVSNPPYIPSAVIETLQPEVKDWEPRQALDGGPDGLDYIREIIAEAPKHLNPKGLLLLEFGINQAKAIRKFARDYFNEIRVIRDYAKIERILLCYN